MPGFTRHPTSAVLSSDALAVLLSIGLALLVRFGVLKIVP